MTKYHDSFVARSARKAAFRKLALTSSLIMFIAGAMPAQADIWRETYSGIISARSRNYPNDNTVAPIDGLGLFGRSDGALDLLPFSATYVMDTSLATYQAGIDSFGIYEREGGNSPVVPITALIVNVNGVSRTFTSAGYDTGSSGNFETYFPRAGHPSDYSDTSAYLSLNGVTTSPIFFDSHLTASGIVAKSAPGVFPSLGSPFDLAPTDGAANASFSFSYSVNGLTTFFASADRNNNFAWIGDLRQVTFTAEQSPPPVDPPPAAVPEPSTWAMLILGFGAVAVTRRRRACRQAMGVLAS